MANRRQLEDGYDTTEGYGTYPQAAQPLAGVNPPAPPQPGPGGSTTPPPAPGAPPPAPAGGFDRNAFRDAWMSSGYSTPDQLKQFVQQHQADYGAGVTVGGKKGDMITLPDGTRIDAVIGAGLGGRGADWTGDPSQMGPPGPSAGPGGQSGAPGAPGYGSGGGTASSGPMFGNEVFSQLKGLFPNGAFNQDVVNRRTENARENLQRFQKSQGANDRAALAARGLLGSGPEQTAQNQLERSVADQYTNAASGIYANESANADSRMMQALQTAAGMTQSQAQQAIDWFRAQNELTLGQGQLGLGYGNLDLNRMLGSGQLALGNQRLGMDAQGQQWQMDHGDTQQLIDLINQLYKGADTSAQGHR